MNPGARKENQEKYKEIESTAIHGKERLQRRGIKFDASATRRLTKVEEGISAKSYRVQVTFVLAYDSNISVLQILCWSLFEYVH